MQSDLMEPPPKRRRLHDHDINGASSQDELTQPQISGRTESSTFDGTGIQSSGTFTVGRDVHINVNSSTKGIEDATKREKEWMEKEMEKKMEEKRREKEREEQRKRLVELLKFSGAESRKFAIKTAHASTCQWILANDLYKRWERRRQDEYLDKLIWLKGKPGAGKSTMMKFLLEKIRSKMVEDNSNEVLISFFLNARGTELEKSTLGLYRSLLLQLFQKRPEVQIVLDEIIEPHGWTVDSLKSIFKEAVLQLKENSVVCLIDALDECGESETRDMVMMFNGLIQAQNNLYVCFASRHYPHISTNSSLEIVLEHQIEHQDDIERYLDGMLHIGPGQLADQIRSSILAEASGIFMWVVLVVEILNREYDAGRKHILRKRVEELPKDLNELFRDILTRDNENLDGVLLCLQWLLFARRPLLPKELYFAIVSGVEPEYLRSCHFEDISEDDISKYILDKSRGLADVDQYRVQFIHESVVDFLIKENGLAAIFPDFGDEIVGKSQNSLKLCCLNYIDFLDSFDEGHQSEQTFGSPSSTLSADLPDFPFGVYAVEEYIFHADQAGGCGIDQKDFMVEFMKGKWIWPLKEDYFPPAPLYLLARNHAGFLIRTHPTDQSCFTIDEAECSMPIMEVVAAGMTDTALALLEMEVRKVPELSFQDLRSQIPLSNHGDILSGSNHSFQRDEDTLVQLVGCAPELVTIVFLRTTKVNVNVTDAQGRSSVYRAIERHHYTLLKHLIALGANLLLSDNNGELPIHWAAQRESSLDIFDILGENKALINAQDNAGKTPLRHALMEKNWIGLEKLFEMKADTSIADHDGRTPLEYAFWHHRSEILDQTLDIFQKYGVDISATRLNGETLLHWALRHGLHSCVSQIINRGVSISTPDGNGHTPIWVATHQSPPNLTTINFLIEGGANIQETDGDGYTLLHRAVEQGDWYVVCVLLLNGACRESRNKHGQSPLDLAWNLGHGSIAKFLSIEPTELSSIWRRGAYMPQLIRDAYHST